MKSSLPHPDPTHLSRRANELRAEIRNLDPRRLAENTGASFTPLEDGPGEFRIPLWGREVVLDWPGLIARQDETGLELTVDQQALLLYHFHTCDGVPPAGRWISFSELPGGQFYAKAFQTYTGDELSRAFGDDIHALEQAASTAGGRPETFAELAFSFQALPQFPLLVAFWQGDEDFPSSMRVLFDASAPHHLPIDVCAITGGMLARRIVKGKPR